MSDIQPGDLVETLPAEQDWCGCDTPYVDDDLISVGSLHRVVGIALPSNPSCRGLIGFEGPSHQWFCVGTFRKIQPYQERFATKLRNAVPSELVPVRASSQGVMR